MKSIKKGFTMIELIIVITILSILGTIGFSSLVTYISDSRNSERITNLTQIHTALKTFKNQNGSVVFPENYFEIKNDGNLVAYQGKISKNVGLATIDNIPYDPKLEIPYTYSITKNKQEYEISLTLESINGEKETALTIGNYKSVSKTMLPTILLATGSTIDVSDDENKKLFIFSKQFHNLPYSFEKGNIPISDGTDFDILLNEAIENNVFYQNSNFSTCEEIKEAKRNIGDGDYELRTETGALVSSGCTF